MWAVVYDIASKDRGGQGAIDVLGANVLELAIEYKFVTPGAEENSRLLSEKNEGETVAVLEPMGQRWETTGLRSWAIWYLCLAALKEVERVNAVRDSAADEREPVEDNWRLGAVLDQQLLENVEDDR